MIMNDLNQLNKLTDKVINCFFKVYNTLGYGFLEKVAVEVLCEQHELHLINYLKATEIEIGLLLNFGKNPK